MKAIYNKELKTSDLIEDTATPPEGWTEQAPRWTEFEAWDFVNDCWGESFDLIKKAKKSEIKQAFKNNVMNGHFNSPTLNIEVDCRRGGIDNDIQNLERLIKKMERESIPETTYKGYTETVPVTREQLDILLDEMGDYGLLLYLKKWMKESEVSACENKEDLENIEW